MLLVNADVYGCIADPFGHAPGKKDDFALVQREALARLATAFCLFLA